MDDLVDLLALQSEMIDPLSFLDPDLRDQGDQPILNTLAEAVKSAGADYLITGDKDLLSLSGRYRILSPGDFWRTYGGA